MKTLAPTCAHSPRWWGERRSWWRSRRQECRGRAPPRLSPPAAGSLRSWNSPPPRSCHQQQQCCGSMTFWCGSGSADPCLWLMDPDPAIFVIHLQDVNKKQIFKKFFGLFLFEGTFTSFSKDKKSKRSHKTSKIKFFLRYYFCLMIYGSGSGFIPLTNGSWSGSRRPKNIRIWRIRVRNTEQQILCHWLQLAELAKGKKSRP